MKVGVLNCRKHVKNFYKYGYHITILLLGLYKEACIELLKGLFYTIKEPVLQCKNDSFDS